MTKTKKILDDWDFMECYNNQGYILLTSNEIYIWYDKLISQ